MRIIFLTLVICVYSSQIIAACPKGFYSPKKLPFNVNVCANNSIQKSFLNHASIVIKRILDFDSDNIADNEKILKELTNSNATFLVITSEKYARLYFNETQNENFTLVFKDEIVLDGSSFDPTLEEAMHLITQFGYAYAYPNEFGEKKGSKISSLMDISRGGFFKSVPKNYPKGAFFTYDDKSCNYQCQITEFTYWVITSFRNQQSSNERYTEIKDEWQLNTKNKIKLNFPELYDFLKKPEFSFN